MQTYRHAALLCLLAAVWGFCVIPTATAQIIGPKPELRAAKKYTTRSPEVLAMVKKGVDYLEANIHGDPGGRCGSAALAGLAIYKYTGDANHKSYKGIVQSIQDAVSEAMKKKDYQGCDIDNYSLGISLIFLTEVMPDKQEKLRGYLLDLLYFRMREYGGWGYMSGHLTKTADTSMTQYGCLSLWTLEQAGKPIRRSVLDKTCDWLLRTQDPSGAFGYQGKIGNTSSYELVEQEGIRLSMVAAAMGSLYICADTLGLEKAAMADEDDFADLALVQDEKDKERAYRAKVPRAQFAKTIKAGNAWFADNFDIQMKKNRVYNLYYLYALERYMSFRELAEGKDEASPEWYNLGVEWLVSAQHRDGCWSGYEETVSDTAFAVLFLLRSTKRSIEKAKDFGPGILVSGRGLPKNLDNIQLRGGKVVQKVDTGVAGSLLDALGDPTNENFDSAVAALAEIPAELAQSAVSRHAAQMKQLVSNPDPEARQAAVRALGKSNNLDCVPLLIYALTDPDPMIALAANDGLKNLSRRLSDFGLKDGFTEAQRTLAIQRWKEWYLTLRPNAVFEEY